jgi:YgiT-type zinc finger domain-containing protein
MKCTTCKMGTTRKGKATITFDRKTSLVIIRDVPAHVCTTCGHCFLDTDITKRVLAISKAARQKNTEFEVIKYTTQNHQTTLGEATAQITAASS